MAAWPTALGTPEFRGFQDRPRPNMIEAPVALGTPKRRRRWTGALRSITFSQTWSLALYRDTFLPFYVTDTREGVLSFTMNDGIKNESGTWLLDDFEAEHVGPGHVRVTLTMTRIS